MFEYELNFFPKTIELEMENLKIAYAIQPHVLHTHKVFVNCDNFVAYSRGKDAQNAIE